MQLLDVIHGSSKTSEASGGDSGLVHWKLRERERRKEATVLVGDVTQLRPEPRSVPAGLLTRRLGRVPVYCAATRTCRLILDSESGEGSR